ncbi:3-methyl-2-oxobutanoate dehydrogenase subunit VorB [Myxococcota bacterium]|nr:3-methyl-2-oxobutanoate dehydrogenase subunit VorB [Myxococcota bacterium]MBU1410975.1 3-methyl-2-oxobutanoate dehydrogenase subunit VorB [Myxococcota bacterium]MBU1512293.1 3-methyl-2-oxobutanoate dehydrogenase subunit VorB [Myxococcota bacterium]
MPKILMKGAEAIGEAAIRAGCLSYFGYPITPQSEVGEYMSRRLPEVGGVFVQAESEVAASQMIYGAAGAGVRVMTTTSSPGYSLMAEAMSYIAASELPAVVVNIVRGGPGLGGILPSQGDYFQAVKGGGHGDYRCLVLAPATVQEFVECVMKAFPLAEKYLNPVLLIGDGMLAQMMEPVDFDAVKTAPQLDVEGWATTGCKDRPRNVVECLWLDPQLCEDFNFELIEKYKRMTAEDCYFEEYLLDDEPEMVVVAYGTTSRIVRTAIEELRKDGYKLGMLRPITLFPFPFERLRALSDAPHMKAVSVVEMSQGQMLEDVRWAIRDQYPVGFFCRMGGIVPSPEEVIDFLKKEFVTRGLKGAKS